MSLFISNNNKFLERFSADSLSYKDISLDKFAGGQIPDSVKENASIAVEVLSEAKELLEQILSDFKNNSDQYIKVKDKVDLIKGSVDKYQTSCKRLSKKIVAFLLKIKKTIKIMSSIKDISSVDEKIESVSLACKEFSDIAEETFEIVRIIENPNFVNELVAKTSKIEKSIEDVDINLKNFSDYILKNILNKKVLSR
jgi:methyl-accepting chemotaxis protein